jgi:phage shock protein C
MRRYDRILRGRLYRSHNGVILGVCRGIADYFDFSLFWTRAITIVLLFLSGFWPVIVLYFVAALVMKPEPVIPFHTNQGGELRFTAERFKRRYANLERRFRRMENDVKSREFDWEQRSNS